MKKEHEKEHENEDFKNEFLTMITEILKMLKKTEEIVSTNKINDPHLRNKVLILNRKAKRKIRKIRKKIKNAK